MGSSYSKLRDENRDLKERIEHLEKAVSMGSFSADLEETVQLEGYVPKSIYDYYVNEGDGDIAEGMDNVMQGMGKLQTVKDLEQKISKLNEEHSKLQERKSKEEKWLKDQLRGLNTEIEGKRQLVDKLEGYYRETETTLEKEREQYKEIHEKFYPMWLQTPKGLEHLYRNDPGAAEEKIREFYPEHYPEIEDILKRLEVEIKQWRIARDRLIKWVNEGKREMPPELVV